MNYNDFFKAAHEKRMNLRPYAYQRRLAQEQSWPHLLDVSTGMGKTAAVTLAWLWKRGWRGGEHREAVTGDTPRRLVWCLPMRALVEQTEENIRHWLDNLEIGGNAGDGRVSVHRLMGGEPDLKTWAENPEEDMILIGTQDMLLSRALMRGYGMSRYQWPIHFSLLHNDCLWVYDEVQLMGAGLATSAQLDAFRRQFPLARNSRSLWVSATLDADWLATVDMKPHISKLERLSLDDADREQAAERLNAIKQLERAELVLDETAGNKSGLQTYVDGLVDLALSSHQPDTQTLVIVNRVDRAQMLFEELHEHRPTATDLLIHGRFRPAERAAQTRKLHEKGQDRIIVATQAIEAGVNISSQTMITELAPWSSMAQRFGRCNRYGECNDTGAHILWIDIADNAKPDIARPYPIETLADARTKLGGLSSANPAGLPATDSTRPLSAVLRRRDFLDLFNTDPDLSGFDVDVADYIRDSDTPGVQVFWRDFDPDPNAPQPQAKPQRDELCPVSMSQIAVYYKRNDVTLWYWDTLDRKWDQLKQPPRPGMILLSAASQGGYTQAIGFDPTTKKPAVDTLPPKDASIENDFPGDPLSQQNKSVLLPDHLGHVAEHANDLCIALQATAHRNAIVRAARWHDLGKLHSVFQQSMYRCHHGEDGEPMADAARPLAKSDCKGAMRHKRHYFRHELASMLAWLEQHDDEPNANLIAYLILAHHGKVRMSLRAMPDEAKYIPEGVKRFARGVYEGDELPALDFDSEHSDPTTLKLALMEIGLGEQGPSWSERALNLLDEYGPFQLAWMETLVRLADWRASAAEQLASKPSEANNDRHELDHSHRTVAAVEPVGAAGNPPSAPAAQGRPEHGLRRRTGGSEDAGSGTRAPHAATRYLDTTVGVLSYAELAPKLARRVEAVQDDLASGAFDGHDLSDTLFRDFHQRICGDLTPGFAGRWRTTNVIVGTHEPPAAHEVPVVMHNYTRDVAARIEHLPEQISEQWLETLAFAEGRLLSIHPFTDFNGRVSRIFIDWLTRRLSLPDIDPTPDDGEATQRYLTALRAGDRLNWQPLMAIWRERLAEGMDT
jgi:CRISPR-associated endonuclease/helicase Cas3